MRKNIRRGTVAMVSVFFLSCLADLPDRPPISAADSSYASTMSADLVTGIEHHALYIEDRQADFTGTTEELFVEMDQEDESLSLFSSTDPQNDGTQAEGIDLPLDGSAGQEAGNPIGFGSSDADSLEGGAEPSDADSLQGEAEPSGTPVSGELSDSGTIQMPLDADTAGGLPEPVVSDENQVQNEGIEESEGLYLTEGSEDESVMTLQERLMELGFMDYAEPTMYYGSITKMAVMLFQRQNDLEQDGIVTQELYDSILSPDAKLYLIKKEAEGEDVLRVQTRLYETGYLSSKEYLTGYFGDITEQAVKQMQEVNGLLPDGIIGQMTIELLYSEDIRSNYISAGEKSDEVLTYQNQLKELGYLTTVPDGIFGSDTAAAVKQFQSRNDLIVDGYLGPTTCDVLMSSTAVPNGLSIGDRGDTVKNVQLLLSGLGYMTQSNATGYYGEITRAAVISFQSANGLSADGMVGKLTMAALTDNPNRKPEGSPSGSQTPESTSSGSTQAVSGSVDALINMAMTKLGSRYVYGAKGPDRFDCSGFVYWCLNQIGVKQSYISSYGWRSVNRYVKIKNFSDIRPGDIVVVTGHVGIASYNGTVIDASSSNGKIVHRDLGSWWKQRFICAWRIF